MHGAVGAVVVPARFGADRPGVERRQSVLGPVEHVERASLKDAIAAHVRSLPRKQARVVELRYGLRDDRPRTIRDVAASLGITGVEAREIEVRALDQLCLAMA